MAERAATAESLKSLASVSRAIVVPGTHRSGTSSIARGRRGARRRSRQTNFLRAAGESDGLLGRPRRRRAQRTRAQGARSHLGCARGDRAPPLRRLADVEAAPRGASLSAAPVRTKPHGDQIPSHDPALAVLACAVLRSRTLRRRRLLFAITQSWSVAASLTRGTRRTRDRTTLWLVNVVPFLALRVDVKSLFRVDYDLSCAIRAGKSNPHRAAGSSIGKRSGRPSSDLPASSRRELAPHALLARRKGQQHRGRASDARGVRAPVGRRRGTPQPRFHVFARVRIVASFQCENAPSPRSRSAVRQYNSVTSVEQGADRVAKQRVANVSESGAGHDSARRRRTDGDCCSATSAARSSRSRTSARTTAARSIKARWKGSASSARGTGRPST